MITQNIEHRCNRALVSNSAHKMNSHRLRGYRPRIFNAGNQHVFVQLCKRRLSVRENHTHDILVRFNAEGAENHKNGHLTSQGWNRDTNDIGIAHQIDRTPSVHFRLRVLTYNGRVNGNIEVCQRFARNIERIERLFLTSNKQLFGAIDDKVATVFQRRLTHLR